MTRYFDPCYVLIMINILRSKNMFYSWLVDLMNTSNSWDSLMDSRQDCLYALYCGAYDNAHPVSLQGENLSWELFETRFEMGDE